MAVFFFLGTFFSAHRNYTVCEFINIIGFHLQDLTVTDDTVLEDHNEDPGLVQMRLIGDGGQFIIHQKNFLMLSSFSSYIEIFFYGAVVESIMRGEVVGMTPRRSRSSTGLMPHAIVVVSRIFSRV